MVHKKKHIHIGRMIFFSFTDSTLWFFFWLLAKLVVNIATIIMATAKNNTAQFLLLSHVVVVTQYNRGFLFGIQQPKWDDVRLFSIKSYRRTRTQTLFFFACLVTIFSVTNIFFNPKIFFDIFGSRKYLCWLSLSSCLFVCVCVVPIIFLLLVYLHT